MIDKYLCSVDDTDYKLIVYHSVDRDFWYLPASYIRNKGRLVNHFKSIHEIEMEFDITLNIQEQLSG